MRKAEGLLSFTAALALLAGACSDDNTPTGQPPVGPGIGGGTTGGTMQMGSPVGAGSNDAGAPSDAGGSSTTADTGTTNNPPPATMDSGTSAPVDSGSASANTEGGAQDGGGGSGNAEFDMCYAMLKDNCIAKEMNTSEKMEVPCKALTTLATPLKNGMTQPSATIKAGPAGGKLDWNQGKGSMFANPVNAGEDICVPFGIESFNEPPETNAEIENLRGVDWALYTVFRPACMKPGEKYPVITWANGTCGEIAGYSALLTTVASYGYVVIASNSTWTGTPPTDTVQLRALDYAKSINEDSKHVLFGRLDMEHIGAMGHSQGAAATLSADSDPRIDAVIAWNSGNSSKKPFLNISGDRDIGGTNTPASMASGVNGSSQPGGWVYFHKVLETTGTSTGHLTLMMQPERVIDLTVAWWDWQLKGKEDAKKMFIGDQCGLCKSKDDYEYGHNDKLK